MPAHDIAGLVLLSILLLILAVCGWIGSQLRNDQWFLRRRVALKSLASDAMGQSLKRQRQRFSRGAGCVTIQPPGLEPKGGTFTPKPRASAKPIRSQPST
jgi:hypothetical protein